MYKLLCWNYMLFEIVWDLASTKNNIFKVEDLYFFDLSFFLTMLASLTVYVCVCEDEAAGGQYGVWSTSRCGERP